MLNVEPEIAQWIKLRDQAAGMNLLMQQINETGGRTSPILKEIGATFEQAALATKRSAEAFASELAPAQKLTAEFQVQAAAITARTAAQRASVAGRQVEVQLAGQNVSWEEKILAIRRASYLVLLQAVQAHKSEYSSTERPAKCRQGASPATRSRLPNTRPTSMRGCVRAPR